MNCCKCNYNTCCCQIPVPGPTGPTGPPGPQGATGPAGITPILGVLGPRQFPEPNGFVILNDIITQTGNIATVEEPAIVILEDGVFEISLCSPVEAASFGIDGAINPAALTNFGLIYQFVDQTSNTQIELLLEFWADAGILSWFFIGRFSAGTRLVFHVPAAAGNIFQHVLQAPRLVVRKIGE